MSTFRVFVAGDPSYLSVATNQWYIRPDHFGIQGYSFNINGVTWYEYDTLLYKRFNALASRAYEMYRQRMFDPNFNKNVKSLSTGLAELEKVHRSQVLNDYSHEKVEIWSDWVGDSNGNPVLIEHPYPPHPVLIPRLYNKQLSYIIKARKIFEAFLPLIGLKPNSDIPSDAYKTQIRSLCRILVREKIIAPVDISEFLRAFNNGEVSQPIDWISSRKNELWYLLHYLYDGNVLLSEGKGVPWSDVCRIFTFHGQQLDPEKIRKNRYTKTSHQVLDKSIHNLKKLVPQRS